LLCNKETVMAVLEAVVERLPAADKEANDTPYSLFYRSEPTCYEPSFEPGFDEPRQQRAQHTTRGAARCRAAAATSSSSSAAARRKLPWRWWWWWWCGGEKGQPTVVDPELSRNVAAVEETADAHLRLLRSPQRFTAKFLIGWRRGRRRRSRRRRRPRKWAL
jgi:hypothetical protein